MPLGVGEADPAIALGICPIRTAGAGIDRLIAAFKNRLGHAERAHHKGAVCSALLIDGADILAVIVCECLADAVAGFDITCAVSDVAEDKATGWRAEGVGLIVQNY